MAFVQALRGLWEVLRPQKGLWSQSSELSLKSVFFTLSPKTSCARCWSNLKRDNADERRPDSGKRHSTHPGQLWVFVSAVGVRVCLFCLLFVCLLVYFFFCVCVCVYALKVLVGRFVFYVEGL